MRARLILPCLVLLAACGCAGAAAEPAFAPEFIIVTAPANPTTTGTPFLPDPALAPTPTLPPTETPVPTDTPVPTETPVPTDTPLPTDTPTLPPPTETPVPTIDPAILPPTEVPPTPAMNSGYVWGEYPGPTIWPISTPIPPPVGRVFEPEGQVVFVLLGSDQRPYGGSFRTDTMIVAVVNPALGTINLLSIPRDLYVYIPGWTVQRINSAMYYGGFETLSMTLEYNLGIRPDFYIMINFNNFIALVDSLGGIEVETAVALTDHRSGYGQYTVGPGTVYMDGETALWYVRSRYTTSDIDRLRRAQEVIQAIAARLMTFDALARLPDFFNLYRDTVTTNLSLGDLSFLAPAALRMRNAPVSRYVIDYSMVYDWIDWYSGAMVLLPVHEAIDPVVRQVLNAP